MNVFDTLTLFGTVVLGAPVGLLGIEFLLGGRPVAGVGFLALAAALVAGGYFKPSLTGIVADTAVDVATVDDPDALDDDEEAYKD
jgi:hypothetical protein